VCLVLLCRQRENARARSSLLLGACVSTRSAASQAGCYVHAQDEILQPNKKFKGEKATAQAVTRLGGAPSDHTQLGFLPSYVIDLDEAADLHGAKGIRFVGGLGGGQSRGQRGCAREGREDVHVRRSRTWRCMVRESTGMRQLALLELALLERGGACA